MYDLSGDAHEHGMDPFMGPPDLASVSSDLATGLSLTMAPPNARVKPPLACEWDGWEVKPRTEVEPEGSITVVAQFIMAWIRRRRQEGAGLTLLAEEEEGRT